MIRISLLGGSRCAWSAGGPPIHLTGQARELLGYLVLHRNRSHRRERLAGLLWGDYEEARARRCLNTALWRLRKSLAPRREADPPLLAVGSSEVGINPRASPWLDVEVFEQATRPALECRPGDPSPSVVARLEDALELYGGELLEDLDAEWVHGERARLAELHQAGLAWLMRHHQKAAMPERAIACGLRLLHADPLREDVHRELIMLFCASGQRGRALRQYDYCRDLLASELGVSPAPETEQLARRLLAGQEPPAAPAAADESQRLLLEALARLGEALRAIEEIRALIGAATRPPSPGPGARVPRGPPVRER